MFEQRSNADLDGPSLKKIAHPAEEMIQLGLLEDQELLLQEEKPYRVGRILGDVYSQGILVDIDYSRAIFWYEKAARLGNGTAMSRLGTLCERGLGGPKDLSQAVQWCRSSFQNGYEESITLLKQLQVSEPLDLSLTTPSEGILVSGTTLRLNPHPSSAYEMYYLAEAYREGNQQVSPDPVLAAYWLRRSLEAGRKQSALTLGHLYASGTLGLKVRSAALYFYKQMAEERDLEAIKALLTLYQEGIVTDIEGIEVKKWKAQLEQNLLGAERQQWLQSHADFRICSIPLRSHNLLDAILIGARQAHATMPDTILSTQGLVAEAFDVEEVPVTLGNKKFLLLQTMAQMLKIRIELYGPSISKDVEAFIVQYGLKADGAIESLGCINPESRIIIHILQRNRDRYDLLMPTEQGLRHYYDRIFSARPILEQLKKEFELSQVYNKAVCEPSIVLQFSRAQVKAVPVLPMLESRASFKNFTGA
ncbi:MAG: sel1 repeat family protein [Gammaproteobacteria bacterium]|nr:sel1 repeat family protein [Gammaproteobacteria bacterium]